METGYDADALVIGLGPAGCMAAFTAAEGGLRVLAVDARTQIGSPPHCGEFVPTQLFGEIPKHPAWIIQSVSAMETVMWEGTSTGVSRALRRVRSDSHGFIIDRARFDRDLARRAASAGAELLCAARVIGKDGENWLIRRKGALQRVASKVTIAADGAMSTVARFLGLPRPRVLVGVQREVPLKRPLSRAVVFLAPWITHGYGWLFPKGTTANVGLGINPFLGTRPNDALDEMIGLLKNDRVVGSGELAHYKGLIPISGLRPAVVFGNTLLCGDAAGLTHPITGAGVSQAALSGRLAGEAAVRLIRGGCAEAPALYEVELYRHFGGPLRHAASKRDLLEARWETGNFSAMCEDTWIAFRGYRVRTRE